MEIGVGVFLLCWSPVLVIAVLAVVGKRPALELSMYGLGFTVLLVWWGFKTPAAVIGAAALDGVVTTVPLLLVIQAGILLSNLLLAGGAIERLVAWLGDGVRQVMHRHVFITLGVANFLEGASVIAEPLVAPLLRASGVRPAGAAALSIIGYAGLMTIELTGVIVTILALVTGLPVVDLGVAAAWLSVPATLVMAACMPWFLVQEGRAPWERLPLLLGAGLVVSLGALAAAYVTVSLAGMVGGLALMMLLVIMGQGHLRLTPELGRDLVPLGFILGALLLVNLTPGLKELTTRGWEFSVQVVPIHRVIFTPLSSAYLYLFAAFGLGIWALRLGRQQVQEVVRRGLAQGWRALVAMALFGAMGQIIAYSGYNEEFTRMEPTANIPWLLAQGIKVFTGSWYPVFVPLLGWVGTFLTGYGVAALMLFGELQVRAAELLGVSATWLAAGLAVGASLGSISSPFKIAIAAPMCGAVGQEGAILRLTIPLGVAAALVIGVILQIGSG